MKRKQEDLAGDLFAVGLQGDDRPTSPPAKLIDAPLVNETATWLAARATTLGSLFASDRAAEYVAILRAFAQFRAGHEPEPLHEDLFNLVCGDEATSEDEALFKSDIRQLKDWQLVTDRIEKERLRGYRDTRRTKFRYHLHDDAVAFVAWLEERRIQDLHPDDGNITKYLLDRQCSLLNELCRLTRKVVPSKVDHEIAGDVLYRIDQVGRFVEATAHDLQVLNLRLLSFGADAFKVDEAREIVDELGVFLERFGRHFNDSRSEITVLIATLRREVQMSRFKACAERMREDAAKYRHIASRNIPDAEAILSDASSFYGDNGRLIELMGRVVDSARKVWGRLNAKLRELERRNHRLDDVKARLDDFARLSEDEVPYGWMRRLLETASLRGDAQIRPDGEKSRPPMPKRSSNVRAKRDVTWITPRKVGEKADVRSIAEARAQLMRDWMNERGIMPDKKDECRLSSGSYVKYEDFKMIMKLVQAVRLGNGEKAKRLLGVTGEQLPERVAIAKDGFSLTLDDIRLLPFEA